MRFILSWLLAATLVAMAGRADAAWYEARSRHFIIYANDNPNRLTNFAERLERFDQAVRHLRGMEDPELTDSNRLRVYALNSERAVSKLIGSHEVLGMYEARVSGAVAFVPRSAGSKWNDWDLDTEAIFFHEYAHHLQLQYASAALPDWVVEGFAEFFATAEISKDGSVLIGKYPRYRAWSFRDDGGLTFERTIGGTYGKLTPAQVDALYARGWLLTHYLTFEKGRQGQLARYVEGIQGGMSAADSARAAFGDLKQFEREVDHYARSSLTALRVHGSALSTGPVNLRPLRPGEAAIMPVHIRSRRGVDEKSAPAVAADARKIAALYPDDPFVQAALAEAEYDAGNAQAADAAADRALAADPKNVHALIYKGRAQMSLAGEKRDSADWSQVRSWFLKANKIDTEDAEPLALFYQTFAAAGQRPTQNAVDALLYAVELAPQDKGVRIMAARELLTENRSAQAKQMLAPLAYRPHASAAFRDAMAKIMAAISAGDAKSALGLIEKGPDESGEGH